MSQYDFSTNLMPPRIIEVDIGVLPKRWKEFCRESKLRPHAVIGYENRARNIKLWPASLIIARGIARGKHRTTDTIVESSSGNFAESLAMVLEWILAQDPTFPIKHIVAVVPRLLQSGKKARLRAYACIQLEEVENAADAMIRAEELARMNGWWYTEQYWNPDNAAAYEAFAREVALQLPDLGMWVCGVGSGGTLAGSTSVLRETFKGRTVPAQLYCVAVAVKRGESVGGVRTEVGLLLKRPGGLPWRDQIDDKIYVGLQKSLEFSAALWQQHPNDPHRQIIGGESTGFALAGGLLSAQKLQFSEDLDPLRNKAGEVIMAFPAPDTYEPYREEYVSHHIEIPRHLCPA